VEFTQSTRAAEFLDIAKTFLHEECLPSEPGYYAARDAAGLTDRRLPAEVGRLKKVAHELGLWNLFHPEIGGLSNVEYAPIAELSGWCLDIMPEAMNCQAPDSGNMETLHLFGTAEQKKTWLEPLLDGIARSAFAMTEPQVASSDATNIETSIVRDGDDYVINGRK